MTPTLTIHPGGADPVELARLELAGKYPPMIGQAAQAGAADNTAAIDALASRERSLNAQLDKIASKLAKLDASFNPAPGSCS